MGAYLLEDTMPRKPTKEESAALKRAMDAERKARVEAEARRKKAQGRGGKGSNIATPSRSRRDIMNELT